VRGDPATRRYVNRARALAEGIRIEPEELDALKRLRASCG
jgi:hypothetical protein